MTRDWLDISGGGKGRALGNQQVGQLLVLPLSNRVYDRGKQRINTMKSMIG